MTELEGKSLLIIDDDPTFTRILARAMKRRGLEVTVAHSVEGSRRGLKYARPRYGDSGPEDGNRLRSDPDPELCAQRVRR